jgi:hypothetical protein
MLLKATYSKGLRRSRALYGFVSPVMLVSQGFQGLMIHVLSVNQQTGVVVIKGGVWRLLLWCLLSTIKHTSAQVEGGDRKSQSI